MKYFIILFLLLIISAAFIIVREKTLKEYSSPDIKLASVNETESGTGESKFKKTGVIILDVADLPQISVTDSLMTPALSGMLQNSRIYTSTVSLSPNRITSLKSFLECLPPYKFNDGKLPFKAFKNMIADSLRNSSVLEEYRKSGYITRLFTADSILAENFSQYFDKAQVCQSKEQVLEELYKILTTEKDTLFFYYADISGDHKENTRYMTDIDHQTGQLRKAIEERLRIEPMIVFVSTQRSEKFSKAPAFFYQKNRDISEEKMNAALTDVAKTLLNYSKITPPNYFGGYDLDNDEEFAERDYFSGVCGDTLLLFNDEYIYKQKKYSEEYYYYDLKQKKDVTNSVIGINEKFHKLLPKYFGGDYAKYIILKNRGDKVKTFKINIRSNRRFEEFSGLTNYYRAEKKNGRYSKDIMSDVEPGATDTIAVYYSNLYQSFDFDFGDKYGLSYGSAGINAGSVKDFNENSYYGMKYYYSDPELFKDFDIRIFNIRINY